MSDFSPHSGRSRPEHPEGGISTREFIQHYPQLFHMAEPGSWPSIERHGLLSTSALLDLFELQGAEREALEARHRPESVTLHHPRHGVAVVRDQKPMSDRALARCLAPPLTPSEWYRRLNARVFFWVRRERLDRLLHARAYRDKPQLILTVDTARLLQRHAARVELSPINSGSTILKPQPRGPDTFLPLAGYPFASWAKKRGVPEAVVELTVMHSVPDLRDFVLQREDLRDGTTVR